MSSNSTYAAILTSIIGNMSLYINFITVIIGTIGGICNVITFTAPQLRLNACVFYLLCATIFQILSILFNIPTRIALDNFGDNLERQSIIFCKLRYYLSIVMPELETYYVLLATFDRCVTTSSNAGIRSWSQLKIAHRLSAAVLIVSLTTAIHIIIFYNIFNNTCQAPADNGYTIFFAIYLIFFASLLPHTLMFVFSLITFHNFKKIRQRILPITGNMNNRRTKRLESQLVKVIIIQVILSSVLVLLRVSSYTYTTMTSGNLYKSDNELAEENFAVRLGIALYYFSFAISFYVSTLTSKFFRDIFWKRIRGFYHYCRRLIH